MKIIVVIKLQMVFVMMERELNVSNLQVFIVKSIFFQKKDENDDDDNASETSSEDFIVSSQASIPERTNFSYKAMTLTNLGENDSQTQNNETSIIDEPNVEKTKVDDSNIEHSNVEDVTGDDSVVEETMISADETLKNENSTSAPIEKEKEKSAEFQVIRRSKGFSDIQIANEIDRISSPVISASHHPDEEAEDEDSETLLGCTQTLIGGSPTKEDLPDTSPILETTLREENSPESANLGGEPDDEESTLKSETEETKVRPQEKVEEEVQSPEASPTKRGRGRPSVSKAKSEVVKPETTKPEDANVRRSGRATRPSTKLSAEDFVSDPFIHDLPISPAKRSASQKFEASGIADAPKTTPAKSPRGRKPKVPKPIIEIEKKDEEGLDEAKVVTQESADSPTKGKKRGRKPLNKVEAKSPVKKAKRSLTEEVDEEKVLPSTTKGGRRSKVEKASKPSTSAVQVEKKEDLTKNGEQSVGDKSSSKEDLDLSLEIDLPIRVAAVAKTYSRKTKTYIEAEEDFILQEILEEHPPKR